jgi:hypothetical protein
VFKKVFKKSGRFWHNCSKKAAEFGTGGKTKTAGFGTGAVLHAYALLCVHLCVYT